MSTLKQRFAELQAEKPNISQADLARATGAKPPSVNAWFTGETKSMKIGTAGKAAALYGVNALWLATGEGYKSEIRESSSSGSTAPNLHQNQAPSTVEYVQTAIKDIATIENILASLSSHLEQVDAGKRTAAAALLSVLSQSPGDPAIIAAIAALLRPQAFTQQHQKAA